MGTYYLPIEQDTIRTMTFAIKNATDPTALVNHVRISVTALDPELPVYATRTMEQWTDESLVRGC